MRYQLKAISPDGRVESLESQAPDRTSAVQQLEDRGYTVLKVRTKPGVLTPWRGARARFPVVLFSQELLVLLNAGLPLVEAIDTLAEKEKRDEFRVVLERIAGILRQGRPLSAARTVAM
jgi:general secretion pathway protein F